MYLYWRNGPYHGPTLSFSGRKELDHQGEMQLEHAGILDADRIFIYQTIYFLDEAHAFGMKLPIRDMKRHINEI